MVTLIGQGGSGATVLQSIAKTIFGAAGLVVVFYILFYQLVPRLLKSSAIHASRDLIILLAIVAAVGATVMAHFVGLSPALGAFIAG